MHEIRFHGRGGQGTVVAATLLANAFFKTGLWVQTFPLFGVERRGAPVEAYLRLDEKKILTRSGVYTPHHIVVQDKRLLDLIDVTRGLKKGGWVLINSDAAPKNPDPFTPFCMAFVDASRIAVKHGLGTLTQPIVNTAMTGAFARVFGGLDMDALAWAIQEEIPIKTQKNIDAAKEAFETVVMPDP